MHNLSMPWNASEYGTHAHRAQVPGIQLARISKQIKPWLQFNRIRTGYAQSTSLGYVRWKCQHCAGRVAVAGSRGFEIDPKKFELHDVPEMECITSESSSTYPWQKSKMNADNVPADADLPRDEKRNRYSTALIAVYF